ncbi:MAG: hypothetical protein NTY45_07060 [Elusimicrobia bacterium]|nr:hypothetical protein [Elusimicrobiota bacterium]
MKKILIAIALLGMTGAAYAGDGRAFGDLKAYDPAQFDASAAAPVPSAPASVAVTTAPAPGGVAPREYIMLHQRCPQGICHRLLQVYKYAKDGEVLLFDKEDSYLKVKAEYLERELPAGEVFNGFEKGGTVCLKQAYEFSQETADSGISGMFRPFPYIGLKGSRLEIVSLFWSGFARMRTVSKYDARTLVLPVDLRLVEPCGK